MSRLLVSAAIAGIVLVVVAFVPLSGRTVVERWQAAPSAIDFVERGYGEVAAAVARFRDDHSDRRRHGAKVSARTSPRGSAPAKDGPAPQERHTEADRSALDRIVAEHAAASR